MSKYGSTVHIWHADSHVKTLNEYKPFFRTGQFLPPCMHRSSLPSYLEINSPLKDTEPPQYKAMISIAVIKLYQTESVLPFSCNKCQTSKGRND